MSVRYPHQLHSCKHFSKFDRARYIQPNRPNCVCCMKLNCIAAWRYLNSDMWTVARTGGKSTTMKWIFIACNKIFPLIIIQSNLCKWSSIHANGNECIGFDIAFCLFVSTYTHLHSNDTAQSS